MAKTALLFMPVLQFFDNSGNELSGGKLHFYEPGTTTDRATYADSAQVVSNPNPIILDSAGRPDNTGSAIQVWLDGEYKLVVKDSADVAIRTEDNITALAEATGYVAKSGDYTVLPADYGKLVDVDASGGARTITLPAAATAGAGFQIVVKKSDSGGNTVTVDANAAETIDGATTFVLSTQYANVELLCDGSGWQIKSDYAAGADLAASGNEAITGNWDFGGATSLEIPNSTTPVVDAAGEIAVDTAVTDHTGKIKYFDGTEELSVIDVPTANLTTTDRQKLVYDATANEFIFEGFVGCRAFRAATQTISASTVTTVQLTSESFDPQSDFDTASTYRYTPSIAGTYVVQGSCSLLSLTDGTEMGLAIYKNGSLAATHTVQISEASGDSPIIGVTDLIAVNGSTDYIDLRVSHSDGASRDIPATAAYVWLAASLVGV